MKRISETPEKREYQLTGLYKQIEGRSLDGRTTTAKVIRELKRELQNYVGSPTVATEILINRIVYKHLRLSAYENAFVENPKPEEKQHYIPLSNSLRLDLQTLQEFCKRKDSPPDLKDYLKKYKVEGKE